MLTIASYFFPRRIEKIVRLNMQASSFEVVGHGGDGLAIRLGFPGIFIVCAVVGCEGSEKKRLSAADP
jgi:hypothetical protein